MSKKIAKLLIFVMLVICLIPNMAYGQDLGLEQAIKKAKSKIDVPSEYEKFNYNTYMISDKRIWGMNWKNENTNETIHVAVNNDGDIVSYRYYDGNYHVENKIPKYSKKEAVKRAEEFINKMNPSLLKEVSYEYDEKEVLPIRDYKMFYHRNIENIPFYENGVEVSVDAETGKVISYNKMWDDLDFPNSKNIISMDKAKELFKKDLGVELVYKFSRNEETLKPYLAYVLKYDRQNAIDANDGKVVKAQYYNIDYPRYENKLAADEKGIIAGLSPEELKAVESSENIMSKEEAQKIARNIELLNISSDYKLTRANVYKLYPEKDKFKWELNFKKEIDKKYDYINVTLDAQSGKVLNFYKGKDYNEKQGKYSKEEAKEKVEKFLEDFSDNYKETVYKKYDELDYENIKLPMYYTFVYRRAVNGIPVWDNYIRVTFNNTTGEIQSYYLNWFHIKFPTAQTISIDKVYDALFKDIGLELNYRRRYEKPTKIPTNKNCNISLVYSIKGNYTIIYDGVTGKLLDYNGKPIIIEKENKDIVNGHKYEKEIKELSDYGILKIDNSFNPDKSMSQEEFLKLTLKAVGKYYDKNDVYKTLIYDKIVMENEKNPTTMIKKQEAIKFFIRALGYEEIAKLGDIFKYPYNPNLVDKEYIGYITIANKISIIGEDFEPKSELTYGESAHYIYNYLVR